MPKTTKIIIGIIIAIVVIGGIWYGVSRKPKEEKVIKIGFIAPLTGEIANWGDSMKGGVEIAVEEINNKRGINEKKLEIIYEDDSCDPKNTVTVFNKLVNIDKVEVVIGPLCSGTVLAVAPIAEEKKVISFSPVATAADISQAGDYVFRNSISDAYQGEFLAEFVFKKLNLASVGVIYVNNDYGTSLFNSFKKKFENLGGKIKGAELYDFGASDFRTNLLKIKKDDIDGLIIICYGGEGGLIAKQAKELGIDISLIGTDNFGTEEVVNSGGIAVEDAIFTTPALDEADPKVKNLKNKYMSRYGKEPPILWAAANAYDAVMILEMAIEERGYSSGEIKTYLYSVQNYQGVGGLTSFDKNGDVRKPLGVRVIKNGEFVPYKE